MIWFLAWCQTLMGVSMRVSNHKTVTISSAGSTLLLDQNAKRREIIFSPPAANAYEISLTGPAVLGGGIRIPAGSQVIRFTEHDIGESIHGAVFAIAESANVTVGVTEIMDT